MKIEEIIKKILPESVNVTPQGFVTEELDHDQLKGMRNILFDKIFEIQKADISQFEGYGEFNGETTLTYSDFKSLLVGTYDEDQEGYWYKWKDMYDTTALDETFFSKYYDRMLELASYCQGQRYLVNNNTFFCYMITDGRGQVGFPDWSRVGIMDFYLDFAIMDLNKPYLEIPESLFAYMEEKGYDTSHFEERFLCMAYFKGLDTLRWHASIDDLPSVQGIMTSMSQLEDRIRAIRG